MVPKWDSIPTYHAFDVKSHRINRLVLKDEVVSITMPMTITLPPGISLLVMSSPHAKVYCKKAVITQSSDHITFTITSKTTTMIRYSDIIARVVIQHEKIVF